MGGTCAPPPLVSWPHLFLKMQNALDLYGAETSSLFLGLFIVLEVIHNTNATLSNISDIPI